MGVFRAPPVQPYHSAQPFGHKVEIVDLLPAAPVVVTPGTGNITIAGFAPTVQQGSGTLTTAPLKNNTTTVQASLTGLAVCVFSVAGVPIVAKNGQTTNGSGVLVVTDPLISPGTQYHVSIIDPVSGAVGITNLLTAT